MNVWVIVARECSSCGGKQAVCVLDHVPTDEETADVDRALGGGSCITLHVYETELGAIETHKDDR